MRRECSAQSGCRLRETYRNISESHVQAALAGESRLIRRYCRIHTLVISTLPVTHNRSDFIHARLLLCGKENAIGGSDNPEVNFRQSGKSFDERHFEVMVGKAYFATCVGLDGLQKFCG